MQIDAETQEFLDSVDIEEELKEFIRQPLRPDPFLECSFPFYEKLLKNTLAIMPRQSFGNDFAAEESLALIQEVVQGQINVKWTLSVPFIKERDVKKIAELFYKIEQFVIRPKIRNLLAQNNLRRGISLGSLSKIAEQINVRQKEINKVIKALEYGSQIELRIRIESTRKRYEETNLCEEKLFKYYNLHFPRTITSSSKKFKHNEIEENTAKKLDAELSKRNGGPVAKTVIIYPSPTYLCILLKPEEIPDISLENFSRKIFSSLELRILEVKSSLTALNPNIDLKQMDMLETIAALIPTSIERLELELKRL
jgi:hypothetical protein